jgi:hypothetical protein
MIRQWCTLVGEQCFQPVAVRKIYSHVGVLSAHYMWVTTLLTNMQAYAWMNGCVLGMRMCDAGVQQGCPLLALLYLVVSEASSLWW